MTDLDFRKITILLLCVSLLVGCNQEPKKMDKVALVEKYYQAMNYSDYSKVTGMFYDSIRFNEMDNTRTFTNEGYRDLIQWDSVFNPKYQILDIKEEGEELHLKISKECDRIMFLQGRPFVSKEVIRFKEGAIYSIDIVEYIDFNDSLWIANRENLVSWIGEHHPELNGFIYDQTKQGALNYLKAIALYKNRQDSIPVHK